MGKLDRVTFGGEVVDRRTAAMLAEAQRLANEKDPSIGRFDLTQGSWSHVSASAGTHSGPGAFDMHTEGFDQEQKDIIGLALRTVGFASWRRDRIPGTWEEHWHGIAMGTEGLPPLAAGQVESYRDGRTGLRGDGVDDQERPSRILTWEQYQAERGRDDGADAAAAADDEARTTSASYDIDAGRALEVEKDSDRDGLTDSFEDLAGTDPEVADTDEDDLSDGYEATVSRTDPLRADTDRDDSSDAAELLRGTDPGRLPGVAGVVGSGVFAERVGPKTPDADRDGLSDRHEELTGTDEDAADTDEDGLADGQEAALGLDPTRVDSDNDGFGDAFEVEHGSDALSSFVDTDGHVVRTAAWTPERAYALRTGKDPDPSAPDAWAIPPGERLGVSVLPGAGDEDRDTDRDGLTDAFEALAGTDREERDTDGDGLRDGVEVLRWRTDPTRADTDRDGEDDRREVTRGTGAGTAQRVSGSGAAAESASEARDGDADGLSDRHEKLLKTDADESDTDEDDLADALELALGTDPLLGDTDGDGVSDGLEVRYSSDPLAVGSTLGSGVLDQGLGQPAPGPGGATPDLDPDPT